MVEVDFLKKLLYNIYTKTKGEKKIMKEQLTKLNEQITNIIEMLVYAKDEKQLNIYLNHLWEVTKEIRNIVGSPNSRKN